jgi:signal transduction histidine kinase
MERKQVLFQKKLMNSLQHNLKTPLNGISVLSQAGLQEPDQPRMRGYFEDILRNSLILTNLLQFIQFYNKKEISFKDLKLSQVKVQRILDNLTWLFERQLKQNNLRLTVEISDPNLKILNDANLIEFVLYQFLENSMQFSKANGNIRIKVAPYIHPED